MLLPVINEDHVQIFFKPMMIIAIYLENKFRSS